MGTAAVLLDVPVRPAALVVLGHGAGGSVDAPDLVAVRGVALGAGFAVARVTQPYRVAGRRAPAPSHQLDAAYTEVVAALRWCAPLAELPVIVGGRSSGARVACRTAAAIGARGVLALAFPLHPPGRPERSRLDELAAVDTQVLVLQGTRDRFGSPNELAAADLPAHVRVHPVLGADHGFAHRKSDPPVLDGLADAVAEWLVRLP